MEERISLIDSHQHFWFHDPQVHSWITDEMELLKRDFLPSDLQPFLAAEQVIGTVAVQANQSELDTKFLVDLALQNPFIKGVVGWVDLMHPDLRKKLDQYQSFSVLKGFRHILQSESPEYMLQPPFIRGLQLLSDLGYTYDLLIYPMHLKSAVQMVKQIPNLKIVLDHMGKPDIKNQLLSEWKSDISLLASFPQVHCKISGIVTEADWDNWRYSELTSCLDHVVESFDSSRLMVGSDWPVCQLAATYQEWFSIVRKYLEPFSYAEKKAILRDNAIKFYGLDVSRE